jgi:hypothetical protein
MAWCSVKAQGQLYLYIDDYDDDDDDVEYVGPTQPPIQWV